eukprot:363276-Chlamydomonas_euryale.AAC.7
MRAQRGSVWCGFDVWPGRRQVHWMTCASGGRRLAREGDQDCLLLASEGPDRDGFRPMGLALTCPMQFGGITMISGLCRPRLSFKATGSKGVLLTCALACSVVLSATTENWWQEA